MKTYNQFLETPFSEEIKPPEPQEEDPSIKSKEKRQMQIKKMVLLKKLQAVRAGAGEEITASYQPEGEVTEGNQRDPENLKKDRTRSKQPDPSKDGFTGIGNMSIKDIMKMNAKMKKEKKKEVKEDKAFEYVKKQIAAKYGKSGYVSKDNPRKPQSAADKAKVRAHQAKVDKENAAARAKDPSQGRYPKG